MLKPMLAASCDNLDAIRYPVLASPKIDGIRCRTGEGEPLTRSLKPIPNGFIRTLLSNLPSFDGELTCGDTFQASTSGIMRETGAPVFTYWIFDLVEDAPYATRLAHMAEAFNLLSPARKARFKLVIPVEIVNRTGLDAYLEKCLAEGYEGVMIRDPYGPYKSGRATFKEGYLTKIKPFEDAEAEVIGFEERMHNGNEAKTNALGRTERSSHAENLVPTGTLGALVCKNEKLWPGQTFNIGTGFDDATRAELWSQRHRLPGRTGLSGRIVKFKYQAIGTVDKPRIPVFLGFRDPKDL